MEPGSKAQRAEWSSVKWDHQQLGPDETYDRANCATCGNGVADGERDPWSGNFR